MILRLLLVLIALSLSGCATTSGREGLPASDLDALLLAVKPDLTPRRLPNGKEYCAELAKRQEAQEDCMGDLEDGFFLSNRDKERAWGTLHTGVERIRLALDPCGFFDFACRKRIRALPKRP